MLYSGEKLKRASRKRNRDLHFLRDFDRLRCHMASRARAENSLSSIWLVSRTANRPSFRRKSFCSALNCIEKLFFSHFRDYVTVLIVVTAIVRIKASLYSSEQWLLWLRTAVGPLLRITIHNCKSVVSQQKEQKHKEKTAFIWNAASPRKQRKRKTLQHLIRSQLLLFCLPKVSSIFLSRLLRGWTRCQLLLRFNFFHPLRDSL